MATSENPKDKDKEKDKDQEGNLNGGITNIRC